MQVVVIRCRKGYVAEITQRPGRKALEELAAVAKPDTLLAWYRKLIADKFDGSKFRQRVGRPRIDEEAERLVSQMAKEDPSWGYDRIVGLEESRTAVVASDGGQHSPSAGRSPAPKRKHAISWKDFIRSHREVLVGMDFFTVGVLLPPYQFVRDRSIPTSWLRAIALPDQFTSLHFSGFACEQVDRGFAALTSRGFVSQHRILELRTWL